MKVRFCVVLLACLSLSASAAEQIGDGDYDNDPSHFACPSLAQPTKPADKDWTSELRTNVVLGAPTVYFMGKYADVTEPGYDVGECNKKDQPNASQPYGSSDTVSIQITSGFSASGSVSYSAAGWTVSASGGGSYSATYSTSRTVDSTTTLTSAAEDCKQYHQAVYSNELQYGYEHTETRSYSRDWGLFMPPQYGSTYPIIITEGTSTSGPQTCNIDDGYKYSKFEYHKGTKTYADCPEPVPCSECDS